MAAATGPRERPILFTAEMVRAILDGRKTQTRRVVNPQPSAGVRWGTLSGGWEDGHGRLLRNMYGRSGDRLWVRETWAPNEGTAVGYLYRADVGAASGLYRASLRTGEWVDVVSRWRSSRFMPRRASRLLLEVTDIRVERLQDISEADAKAEGIKTFLPPHPFPPDWPRNDEGKYTPSYGVSYAGDRSAFARSARDAYVQLWDQIHAKDDHGWASNPWVWVVSFRSVPTTERSAE